MNWKLIFQLSLFGLAMAFASISLIPAKIEPACWVIIFIICAYILARKGVGNYFLHGFILSLANSVWITSAHVLFYHAYMAHHPELSSMSADMGMARHPRVLMLLSGPIFGAAFGLVQGLFAFVAAKIMKKT